MSFDIKKVKQPTKKTETEYQTAPRFDIRKVKQSVQQPSAAQIAARNAVNSVLNRGFTPTGVTGTSPRVSTIPTRENAEILHRYRLESNSYDIEAERERLSELESKMKTAKARSMDTRHLSGDRRKETRRKYQKEYDELKKQVDSLRSDVELAEWLKVDKSYTVNRENPDFAEKSRYVSTANGKEAKTALFDPIYLETGFDDINYDYINKNKDALDRQQKNEINTGASFLGVDSSFLNEMTDDEIALFNYLYAQDTANGDAEHKNAYSYIEHIASNLNARQRAKETEKWQKYANEHPVKSSAFSVLTSPLKGFSYIGQAADYLEDRRIDQNAGYNKFSYIPSSIRGQVVEDIEKNVEGVWGKVGSFAYQTGMSMGDFLLNTGITGGNQALTLSIMGTGAAADATISAKDRGLSDDQAFALGTIAGLAEVATEKVSLEALLKPNWEKGVLNYVLKNAVAEGSEEVASDIINLTADIIISKDKSEWAQSVQAYMDQGYTESEAFGLAVQDQAIAMGLDFVGGALSGGIMSGAAGAGHVLTNYQTGKQINSMNLPQSDVQSIIDEGLASDPSTQAHTLAVDAQNKLTSGETLTDYEIGNLYQANLRAIEAENAADQQVQQETQPKQAPAATQTAQEAAQTQTNEMARQSPQERTEAVKALDTARVARASSVLGENGQKALNATYDGQTGADQYYGGFAAYYQAGVSGQDINKVNSEYSGAMTPAQKYAAYSAGKNDAAVSLAREKEAARFAPVAGEKSGLVYDEFVRQAVESGRTAQDVNQETRQYLTAETAERVNTLAKDLGVRVRFVDSVAGGRANAQIKGSEVLVERNNPNPVMSIVGHELTHRMQQLAPDAYRSFRDIVMQEDGQESRVQQRIADYARQGVTLDTEEAMDEVAADYAGRMMDDGKVLDDFIRKNHDNRTVLEKLRDAFRALWQKLTGKEKQQAGEAEKKLTAALEAAAAQAEQNRKSAAQTQDGEVKYSIKNTRNMTLNEQLKAFYDGRMVSSDAFYFGETPAVLKKAGFDSLPLAMTIGDFRKSTQKKHNIPRRVLKNLMTNLSSPLFSFGKGYRAGIVLDDIDGSGYKLLAALERGTDMDRKPVNVINSLYGIEHPAEWIRNQINSGNEFILYDEKRANAFLQTYGYSASVGDGIHSMDERVPQTGEDVKPRYSLKETDSQGREISDRQQVYFRNSKITDEDGRLLVLYHGTTAYGDITKFRRGRSGWLGPGIYLSSRQVDAQRYADAMGAGNGKLYELYANVTNPLVVMGSNPVPEILRAAYGRDSIYQARSAKQGNDTKIITPADIKKLQSKGYDGIRWDFGKSTEVSVFSPEQIKRVDNKTPTENPDIRYSLKEGTISKSYEALLRENDLLRERVDYWKGQTRRTERITTDKKAVEKAARALIRDYGAQIGLEDIRGDLQSLYDYISSGSEGKNELTYTEARRRAENIASKLVENAVSVDDTLYQDYQDLRKHLKNIKLTISEADSQNLTDYNDFRKRNFGRLNIGKGKTNIDQVYQELAEMWPGLFNEQEYNNPADQLYHIAEVLDTVGVPQEYNPFSGDMRNAVAGAANEILERFFDLPQTRATFADRQAAKLDKLRWENRDKVQKAIARERGRRAEEVKKLKEHYRERDAAGRESRNARELRGKIIRHVRKLSQKLLKPSDKMHIPENLRQATAAALDAVNLESAYSVDRETGKQVKDGSGTPTKRTEAFQTLREQYEKISRGETDFTGVLDPDLLDNLAEVVSMRDVPIASMSTEQLSTVWHVVKAIEHSVSTANKLLGKSRFEGVKELAEGIRDSSASKRAKGNWKGPAGWTDRLLNVDMMDPVTYFHLFGEGGDALYRELQAARDQRTRILAETVRQAQEVVGKTDVKKLMKQTHTFQVEGGNITLTTGQIMSLYELSKRQQAQDHIYKGGLRATPIDSGVSRNRSAGANLAAALGKLDAPAAGVRVSQGDVSNILSTLTEDEIKIADGLQSIMQNYLAGEGNRESLKVYGYKKFTEENYFPISSDPHQIQDKIGDVLEGGQKRPRSIAEWGSAKSTVSKANNGLLLGDIFDVFAQHAVDMSTYASHLGAMEDLNRVRNFTFRTDEGVRTGTMGDIIQRVAGQQGGSYLNKLLQDISAGTAKDSVTGLGKLSANYKAASVGANLRVALQQPTAYLRAAAVMNPKYLADPRVMKKGGWKKALEYAPIAQWKDWGNFEINQGRQIQNIMFDTDTALEKTKNASMWLAGQMDSVTWGRIWNACELEIRDTRKDLTPGSKEFYEAAAQRFTDVVDQTQVVDNVLGRSQIMRSGDNLSKMATSYMGEPTKSYNLVYRAVRDLAQETNKAKRTAAIKRLGRATAALAASQYLNAIAQALWDAVRDDDDRDKKYWERVLGHIGGNFADNINPVGMVPYAKDIKSMLQGYDVKRLDTEAIASFVQAAKNLDKAINGEGRYTLAGAGANMLAETGRMFGLPVPTVKRDLMAIARSIGVETGDLWFQYQIEKAINSIGYSGNRKEFYDIAWTALKNGETGVYQDIVQDLMDNGVKGSTIESAMKERFKAAKEEDKTFRISENAQDLIGYRETYGKEKEEDEGFSADDLSPSRYKKYNNDRSKNYRDIADDLEGFSGWKRLDGDVKDKALSAADSLTDKMALEAHSGGKYSVDTKWMKWATGGENYGVSEAEAILFKVAYDMSESDKDKDGKTISGSKKDNVLEKATDMMPWLTDEELAYLMSNYWK